MLHFIRAPRIGAVLAAIALAQPGFAAAQQPEPRTNAYAFTTVDVPFGVPGVDLDMQAVWINDQGVLTAQYQMPRSPVFLEHMNTAVLRNGQWTPFVVPGAVSVGGTNQNSRGQVVLTIDFGDGIWHAAYQDRRGLTLIPLQPGYPGGTLVQGVNDRGELAAVVVDGNGGFHAMVGKGANSTVFDFPDATTVATQANGINNHGVAVGIYVLADGTVHSFLHQGSCTINIDPPTGSNAQATWINNEGVVIGAYTNPSGLFTGYVRSGDRLQHFAEIHVPGSAFTFPMSINDHGVITGVYGDGNGAVHGFVAWPTR